MATRPGSWSKGAAWPACSPIGLAVVAGGLAAKVPHDTWQAIVDRMGSAFHEGRFEDGLTQALAEVSALLVRHFPAAPGATNPNELPDAPVLG